MHLIEAYFHPIGEIFGLIGFVDLNGKDDSEGKTEIGKSTRFSLEKRAASQHEAPGNRLW